MSPAGLVRHTRTLRYRDGIYDGRFLAGTPVKGGGRVSERGRSSKRGLFGDRKTREKIAKARDLAAREGRETVPLREIVIYGGSLFCWLAIPRD